MDGYEEEYLGKKFKVVHCKGAKKSFDKAMPRLQPPKRKNRMVEAISAFFERLADGERFRNEVFRKEDTLPDGTHFRAFRKLPIRAYVWASKSHPDTYFVSHYVYKKKQELDPLDTDKVRANWRRIEENGDER